MSEMVKTKESLASEYYRTTLFGESNKRRALSAIKQDLDALCKDEAEAVVAEIEAAVKETKDLAEQAVNLLSTGVTLDDLRIENIYKSAPVAGGSAGEQYIRKVCQEKANSVVQPKAPNKEALDLQEAMTSFKEEFPHEWTPISWKAIPQNLGNAMYQYCYCGLWPKDPSSIATLNKKRQDIQRLYQAQAVENALVTADTWLAKAQPLCAAALKRSQDTPQQAEQLSVLGGPLKQYVDFQRKNKVEREHRKQLLNTHSVKICSLKTSQGHPNEIYRLAPASEWTLYVDESGQDGNFMTGGRGIIAGALCNSKKPLPPQPKLHACDDATEQQFLAGDKVIECLLNHEQCGVLAIPAKAYDSAQGWGSLIASFIDLVLRLLPLPAGNSKVKLNVVVEGRDPYANETDFSFLADACRYNLMHVFPERANRIDFSISVMDKNDSRNAYPDLIAHTCFCGYGKGNSVAVQRLQQSGWEGTCFLNYPAEKLRTALEYFYGGRNLPPAEWDEFLQTSDFNASGLIGTMLQTIGRKAATDLALWKTYLDWTVQHLSSKAISLRKLRAQLNWLKRYQPAEAELPPRIKLLWLTSQLAEANHLGEIESQTPAGKEFLQLIEELYEEDAPLVCWAVLHLAVQKTNAYQFEEAKQLVTQFSDIGSLLSKEPPFTRMLKSIITTLTGIGGTPNNYAPAAIPGLRYYGQLLSSCGQHEAFLGNQENAIIYFQEAIRCFEKLSENKALDIDQTRAYYATAQMDISATAPKTRAVMEQYLGGPIPEMAHKLAVSSEDVDKYHHHILLRYLAQSKDAEGIAAYLAEEAKWQDGYGHPWEMIEFYRALLLNDADKRWKHIQNAWNIACKDSGSTIHVIACVILGAAFYDQRGIKTDKYMSSVDEVAREIPALGAERIQALRQQATHPIHPLELAKIVLPFNFR